MIYAATSRGIAWESLLGMELWQIAAALGLHRLETRAQQDQREIYEAKSDLWDETGEQRMEQMAGYSERRAASQQRRREERVRLREEEVNAR